MSYSPPPPEEGGRARNLHFRAMSGGVEGAQAAVLVKSEDLPDGTPRIRGYDFNQGVDLSAIIKAAYTTGFQATNLALAVDEVNRMRSWRLSDKPWKLEDDEDLKDPQAREGIKCTIFLSYTSNMVSCGVRESIKFLCQHRMVDCLVTTAGGVEEDFIKCMHDTYLGDFALKGVDLRLKGQNRIGNLIVPNKNYCSFEDWLRPILHTMTDEQVEQGKIWTPSTMIERLGKEIDHEDSIYYWCYKNKIPVFCPAITDGSIGNDSLRQLQIFSC
jgi:deoxyhypusine synthase